MFRGGIAVRAAMLVSLLLAGPSVAQPPPPPPPPAADERVLRSLLPAIPLGPGVTQRDFTTTDAAGQVMGHLIEVELAVAGVSTDLLTAGAVAARGTVADMADARGAVGGINGDFFDIGRTSAAAGPAISAGRPLKAAVPAGRRLAPAVPGATPEAVFGVGIEGVGRIDRLTLDAAARTLRDTIRINGLNQYAIRVDGIGLFTSDWGTASRARSVCGSNSDPDAGCSPATEVIVRGGQVSSVGPNPGSGAIPPGTSVLVGRDAGAAALAGLEVGDPVTVTYRLVPETGGPLHFAVGGSPILHDGAPQHGLDDAERAPRSGAGVSADGRRMYLVAVDGRQDDSVGATLAEFAALLGELSVDDAVNLDGGGSSTLVYRRPGEQRVSVVNDPSDSSPRMVSNGIGVFTLP